MSDAIISVDRLSKRYVIGHQANGRDGLRHAIEDAIRNPVAWLKKRNSARRATREEFWALRDVSFEINEGDAVAIVGKNGAGKSTLLKILSRITEPTHGSIRLRGRVASLLEVGTGFHQELTGRENIFLNGAILGMSKAEIKRKFDEIVAFSEIEKFLDTPVKRYSSGMYVRLAFAVAAHLEPEILVVDEVLAVGDAAFQKKCLGKMGDVAKGGRTVLFVSHNMGAVQALCKKAVHLHAGRVKSVGDVDAIVGAYLADVGAGHGGRFSKAVRLGDGLTLTGFDCEPAFLESGKPLQFKLVLRAEKNTTINDLSILFYSSQNTRVALVDLRPLGLPASLRAGQSWQAAGEIKSVPFVEGDYSVGLFVNATGFLENVFDLTAFSVTPRARTDGFVPVPTVYRGVVELDVEPHLVTAS